jgi:hypothetical protein
VVNWSLLTQILVVNRLLVDDRRTQQETAAGWKKLLVAETSYLFRKSAGSCGWLEEVASGRDKLFVQEKRRKLRLVGKSC